MRSLWLVRFELSVDRDKRDWARDSVKRDLRVAWTTEVFLALFLCNLYSASSVLQFDGANFFAALSLTFSYI